jgi:hypothetical protein
LVRHYGKYGDRPALEGGYSRGGSLEVYENSYMKGVENETGYFY